MKSIMWYVGKRFEKSQESNFINYTSKIVMNACQGSSRVNLLTDCSIRIH